MEKIVLKEGEGVMIVPENKYDKANQEIIVEVKKGKLIIIPSMSNFFRKYEVVFGRIEEIK
jgi:oxalate decarboxylase/phosphoglucose isomerase-like protein (cupin superfamily)